MVPQVKVKPPPMLLEVPGEPKLSKQARIPRCRPEHVNSEFHFSCDADGLTRNQLQQSCAVDGWIVGVGRLGFAVKKNISCVGASRGMCVAQGQQRQSTHRQKLHQTQKSQMRDHARRLLCGTAHFSRVIDRQNAFYAFLVGGSDAGRLVNNRVIQGNLLAHAVKLAFGFCVKRWL